LHELVAGAADASKVRSLPVTTPSTLRVDAWYGDAVAFGSDVARTAFVNENEEQAVLVLVLDARSGAVTDALCLPYEGRSQGCCGVLGWLDTSRVLFRDGDQLLARQVGTERLQRLATLPAGATVTLALAS
jgi:hypothetical protein